MTSAAGKPGRHETPAVFATRLGLIWNAAHDWVTWESLIDPAVAAYWRNRPGRRRDAA